MFSRMTGVQRPLSNVGTAFVLFCWGLLRRKFDPPSMDREDKNDVTAYVFFLGFFLRSGDTLL